jgi:hypothetical protein
MILDEAALASREKHGPFDAGARMRSGTPAAAPLAANAGPLVMARARQVATSARSHRPWRRRRVLGENRDLVVFRLS